jgi:DnaA-homolog protein
MFEPPYQLPLRLPVGETLASFWLAGDNSWLAWLQQQLVEPAGFALLVIHGPAASGKSHLLHALTSAVAAREQPCFALSFADESRPEPALLDGLESCALVAFDDLHEVAGDAAWELALFNLLNRMRELNSGLLVITANQAPRALGIALPDLASRLDWGMVVGLLPLDDDNKLRALQLRAQLRGLTLSDEVGRYLLQHLARDMRSLCHALERLDRASLVAQRRLTLPFIKQVLAI